MLVQRMSRLAERAPGWIEWLLIPTLESRVREIVKAEVGHLEKIMEARFDGVNSKMDAKFEAVNSRIDSVEKRLDSLEKGLPVVRDLAFNTRSGWC